MKTSEIKHFITEYTDEVWNKGNVEAMDRFYTPNYVHHDISRPDLQTLDHYKDWAKDLLAGLQDFHVAIDDLVAEDGKAVKRWTASGIHNNTFAGIPATGKQVSFCGVSTYRLEGDKISESWYLYDLLGLLQQLGVIPLPETVENK